MWPPYSSMLWQNDHEYYAWKLFSWNIIYKIIIMIIPKNGKRKQQTKKEGALHVWSMSWPTHEWRRCTTSMSLRCSGGLFVRYSAMTCHLKISLLCVYRQHWIEIVLLPFFVISICICVIHRYRVESPLSAWLLYWRWRRRWQRRQQRDETL